MTLLVRFCVTEVETATAISRPLEQCQDLLVRHLCCLGLVHADEHDAGTNPVPQRRWLASRKQREAAHYRGIAIGVCGKGGGG